MKDRGLFKRDCTWYIQYFFNGRRLREAVGESKTEAKAALAARKTQIREGKFFPDKKKEKIVTWDDFLPTFKKWAEQNVRPKSYRCYCNNIDNLHAHFQGKRMSQITPKMIESFKTSRLEKDNVCTTTVNRDLACLKRMFNLAIKWDYAETNPVCKVGFFREKPGRLRYLTKEEIDALLSVCPHYLRNIVEFDLQTGLRRGELFAIKWQDVDMENRMLTVRNTKNHEDRMIPLNDIAVDVLKRIPRQLHSDYVFSSPATKPGSQLIDIKKSFSTALDDAKIKDFRFHDLRHTFASHMVMAGVDLVTAKELLGHKDIKMTLRYSHLSPAFKKRGVDLLCSRFQSAPKLPHPEEIKKEAEA